MKILKLSALIMAMLLTSSAMARGHGEKGKGRGGKFAKFLKELNLTKEQLEKLKAHRKANKEKGKPDRGQMRTLREEMSKAFVNGATDAEMRALNEKINKVKEEMNQKRLDKMIFFKNLLTKEQREKFMEKRKARKGRRKKGGKGPSFD